MAILPIGSTAGVLTVSCHCTERHEQKLNNNLKFENYDRKRTN